LRKSCDFFCPCFCLCTVICLLICICQTILASLEWNQHVRGVQLIVLLNLVYNCFIENFCVYVHFKIFLFIDFFFKIWAQTIHNIFELFLLFSESVHCSLLIYIESPHTFLWKAFNLFFGSTGV
jgi:hypothetical protein